VAVTPDFFREVALTSELPWQDLGDVAAPEYSGRDAAIHHAFELSKKVQNLELKNKFLCLVGGDHGQALGSVHGLLHHYPDMIVVWMDAHADANVPSASPTGNMHGMPLAWLLGASEARPWWLKRTLNPKRLIYIGPRSIDSYERMLIEELDIAFITPEEARGPQFAQILKRHLNRMDPKGQCPVHMSLDVDVLDAGLIQGTGTRVDNGLAFEDVELAFKIIGEHGPIVSTEVVEINPELSTLTEARELCLWARDLVLEAIPAQKPGLSLRSIRNAFSDEWRLSL
jgi:arginase